MIRGGEREGVLPVVSLACERFLSYALILVANDARMRGEVRVQKCTLMENVFLSAVLVGIVVLTGTLCCLVLM